MLHLISYYDERHGEYETGAEVVIPFTEMEEPQDAIHDYFSRFYGDGTETVEEGRTYMEGNHMRGLHITSYDVLPPGEVETVKKYVSVAHREEVDADVE